MRCRRFLAAGPIRFALVAATLPWLIGAGGSPRIAGQVGGPIVELCLVAPPANDFGLPERLVVDPSAEPCERPIAWDAEGRFVLTGAKGKILRARFENVGSFSTGILGNESELPRLAPESPGTYDVAVADMAGRAVIGARVFIDTTTTPLPPWRPDRRSALTDSTGRARLPYWQGERLEVSVAARYALAWQSKPDVIPDVRVFLAQVTPQRPRVVQVLTGTVQPRSGVAVSWKGVPLGVTDSQGRVEVNVEPDAELHLFDSEGGGWWLPAAAWQERKAIETLVGGRRIATGRVFDAAGRPAPSARVRLFGKAGAIAEKVAGEDGSYTFGPLAEESYDLRASLPGAADALAKLSFGAEHSGRVAAPDLMLGLDGAMLGGIVLGADGAPLSGAGVRVLRGHLDGRAAAPPVLAPDALTRDDGSYLVGGLKPGERVALEFRASGHLPALLPELVADGTTNLDVHLEAATALEVAIVDPDGAAVGGTRIELASDENAPQRITRSLEAGADGRALFDELPPGIYEIDLRTTGYIRQQLRIGLEPGARRLAIELAAGATLAGQFRDEMGMPIAGAFVSLRDPQATTHIVASAQTDGEGRFHVAGIPLGSWRLEAAAPRRPPLIDTFEAERLEDYQRDLALPPGEILRGVVLDAGMAPVAGAQVTIVETWQGVDSADNPHDFVRALAVTSTDGAGAFGFEKLARRHYKLSVRAPGGGAATQAVEAGGAEPFVQIVLAEPRIQ